MRDYPKKKQKKPPRLERALAALMNQSGTWLDIRRFMEGGQSETAVMHQVTEMLDIMGIKYERDARWIRVKMEPESSIRSVGSFWTFDDVTIASDIQTFCKYMEADRTPRR